MVASQRPKLTVEQFERMLIEKAAARRASAEALKVVHRERHIRMWKASALHRKVLIPVVAELMGVKSIDVSAALERKGDNETKRVLRAERERRTREKWGEGA